MICTSRSITVKEYCQPIIQAIKARSEVVQAEKLELGVEEYHRQRYQTAFPELLPQQIVHKVVVAMCAERTEQKAPKVNGIRPKQPKAAPRVPEKFIPTGRFKNGRPMTKMNQLTEELGIVSNCPIMVLLLRTMWWALDS